MVKYSFIIPFGLRETPRLILNSIKSSDLNKKDYEIILIRGNQPSIQRNKGVESAKGDIIFFFDSDCVLHPKNIKKQLEYYKNKNITGVGGPNLINKKSKYIQKVFGFVLANWFATQSMSARYKKRGKTRYANEKDLILCNFSMRKKVFLELNGFNTNLYPNEENEFLIVCNYLQ